MKDIVDRLREKLITVPKPGAVPFDYPGGFCQIFYFSDDQHPPKKPGDSAGLGSSHFKTVEMVYAESPLEWEAAAEIERLRAAVKT